VDDNVDSVEILTILLNLSGHEAHIAHDGLEAMEAAGKFRPDVILLDIGLPKLNGYDVARRIRAAVGEKYGVGSLDGLGSGRGPLPLPASGVQPPHDQTG
jgi:DNA-binding response OmpR family regulator